MKLERIKAHIARDLPAKVFDIRLSRSARDRVAEVHQLLVTHPDRNVVVYSNHVAFGDPAVWAYIGRSIDPDASRQAAVLASKYHMTFRLNPPFSLMTHVVGFLTDARVIPTIQSYMKGDPQWGFSDEDIRENELGIGRAIHAMKRDRRHRPIMLFIAPEGTRSTTGALMDHVESGITKLGSMLAPVEYVPLGLIYSDGFQRGSLNTRSKRRPVHINVEIGEPIFQKSRKPVQTLDEIMTPLVRVLPRNLRGSWGRLA